MSAQTLCDVAQLNNTGSPRSKHTGLTEEGIAQDNVWDHGCFNDCDKKRCARNTGDPHQRVPAIVLPQTVNLRRHEPRHPHRMNRRRF